MVIEVGSLGAKNKNKTHTHKKQKRKILPLRYIKRLQSRKKNLFFFKLNLCYSLDCDTSGCSFLSFTDVRRNYKSKSACSVLILIIFPFPVATVVCAEQRAVSKSVTGLGTAPVDL